MQTEHIQPHHPRVVKSTQQDLMPARYSLPVQLLSMAAFTLAFVGWLNETWLMWFENPIWLNRYTEYAIILCFGLWRILAEKNVYTRKRLMILVFMVTVFWWLIPWLYPMSEPYVGFLWGQPVFPSLHVPGTITFFLILAAVFLFGRRIICGFNCPCVGVRETVGFAFRDRTLRSDWTWKLRHSKWFFFIYYVGVMVVTQFPPNSWTVSFVGGFYLVVAMTYFGSFFIAPVVGNRFYCRYLCPYGATFGLLNHAGFYGINMDTEKCIDCLRCEQVCDMGIPVWKQGKEAGRITALEDCMGCARCVVSCPTDALEVRDVRNLFRPALKQNASHLLKRKIVNKTVRQESDYRPTAERREDWKEASVPPVLAQIQKQAARCLDCGVPGCTNACPLKNRIPEWLEAVADGDIKTAAEISHATSNLPEVCGRLCPQHRLCEGSCTKAREEDGAVTIGLAERFITDEAFRQGWKPAQPEKQKYNGRSIAVIGAGPAGLACADELNKLGCEVTVFDREMLVGGLMATAIPPFKLGKSILRRRQTLLEQRGVHFQLGIDVGAALMQKLVNSYDAVFLGLGAQNSRTLDLPGSDLDGVYTALDFLADVNRKNGGDAMSAKRVLVLGGGDSAMDCARSAIRQGATSVSIICRGTEDAMRASPKEQQMARDEGVQFIFETSPLEIIGEQKISAVRFNQAGDIPVQVTLDCDALMFAVGQLAQAPSWLSKLGVETDEQGLIRIDARGRTSHSKIYAGGDNTHGPDLIVTAIVAGRCAAEGIIESFSIVQKLKKAAGLAE
ncbi:Glutamate synthase [NADPH] small chain [hydrothermal vent metagenome]|uniref:Glutamate synthase [NADPH] small chain n=1 Tax=hydrothermal vent metagenome TaxID=652676 RepID=A0A3B1BHF3_9ZZZZ